MELSTPEDIDYKNLCDLLVAQKWLDADRETASLLLVSAGIVDRDWLEIEDIQAIDCMDFFLIDRIWSNHSNGRFGFRSQLAIYQEFFYDFKYLSDRLGWQLDRADDNIDSQLNIFLQPGHYPKFYLSLSNKTHSFNNIDLNWIESFFTRLSLCEI